MCVWLQIIRELPSRNRLTRMRRSCMNIRQHCVLTNVPALSFRDDLRVLQHDLFPLPLWAGNRGLSTVCLSMLVRILRHRPRDLVCSQPMTQLWARRDRSRLEGVGITSPPPNVMPMLIYSSWVSQIVTFGVSGADPPSQANCFSFMF